MQDWTGGSVLTVLPPGLAGPCKVGQGGSVPPPGLAGPCKIGQGGGARKCAPSGCMPDCQRLPRVVICCPCSQSGLVCNPLFSTSPRPCRLHHPSESPPVVGDPRAVQGGVLILEACGQAAVPHSPPILSRASTTATRSPGRDRSSSLAQQRPEIPAPTTTTSNLAWSIRTRDCSVGCAKRVIRVHVSCRSHSCATLP